MGLDTAAIVRIIKGYYPEAQALYLFGSAVANAARPDGDLDLALLLSPPFPGRSLLLTPCHLALTDALSRRVDLVPLRAVSTVMQKEVIATGRILDCADHPARLEFEMLVVSLYQKLHEERRAILEDFRRTGRAYAV